MSPAAIAIGSTIGILFLCCEGDGIQFPALLQLIEAISGHAVKDLRLAAGPGHLERVYGLGPSKAEVKAQIILRQIAST